MGQYGPNSIAAESAGTTRHGPNLSKRSKGGLGALNFRVENESLLLQKILYNFHFFKQI